MLRALALACWCGATCAFVACGSSNSEDLFEGASSTSSNADASNTPSVSSEDAAAASADSSAPPVQDATATVDVGAPPDTGPSCTALQNDIENKRKEAIVCSPLSLELQCGEGIDGLCCKLWVTDSSSKAAKDFKAAVDAYKNAKCAVSCVNVDCTNGPTYSCQSVSGARGACAQK